MVSLMVGGPTVAIIFWWGLSKVTFDSLSDSVAQWVSHWVDSVIQRCEFNQWSHLLCIFHTFFGLSTKFFPHFRAWSFCFLFFCPNFLYLPFLSIWLKKILNMWSVSGVGGLSKGDAIILLRLMIDYRKFSERIVQSSKFFLFFLLIFIFLMAQKPTGT